MKRDNIIFATLNYYKLHVVCMQIECVRPRLISGKHLDKPPNVKLLAGGQDLPERCKLDLGPHSTLCASTKCVYHEDEDAPETRHQLFPLAYVFSALVNPRKHSMANSWPNICESAN